MKIRDLQHTILDRIIDHSPWLNLRKRADQMITLFESDLTPESSILDIGSGPGIYFAPLKQKKHEVILLDVKKFKSCPFPVTLYDGNTIPLPDKSIDTCLLITVLHHTQNPIQILKEANRVSRRNIIIIEDIYESRLGWLTTRLRDMFFNFEYFGHPLNFKSYREWKETFHTLGLTLERERKLTSFLLGIPIATGLFVLNTRSESTQ